MKTQKTLLKTLLIFSLCFIAPVYAAETSDTSTDRPSDEEIIKFTKRMYSHSIDELILIKEQLGDKNERLTAFIDSLIKLKKHQRKHQRKQLLNQRSYVIGTAVVLVVAIVFVFMS